MYEIAYMKRLLDDFSILNDATKFTPVPVDMKELAYHVIDSFHALFDTYNIDVGYTIPDTLPSVLGDADKLQQVFINLLKNALDALEDIKVIHFSLDFDHYNGKDYLLAIVTDTGSGIAPEHVQQIFGAFNTYGKDYGTGIGLAVAKQIIEAHHGVITVESTLDHGSSFFVRLPIYCEGK